LCVCAERRLAAVSLTQDTARLGEARMLSLKRVGERQADLELAVAYRSAPPLGQSMAAWHGDHENLRMFLDEAGNLGC
jgi:hypothetical protein